MYRLASLLLLLLPATGFAFDGRVVTAEGTPVAGGEVTILGHTGVARTDADGRFNWTLDPAPPFEVMVIAPGGIYMKPVLVERFTGGVVTLTVVPLVNEHVTVSGSAGSIETPPGSAKATLTSREIQTRMPANLIQALENVAGVNQVSEGQAAVRQSLQQASSLAACSVARVAPTARARQSLPAGPRRVRELGRTRRERRRAARTDP